MTTADAVSREAAWLSVTTDSLPALLTTAGGPFQVIQAYWPGAKFAANKTAIYVQRKRTGMPRAGGQRIRPNYSFFLKLVWPVKATAAGIAETEQQAFDNAIELLLQRIDGLPQDKTHGGRFLSVGEAPVGRYPEVAFDDPEQTIPAGKWLRATVTYPGDDLEFYG